MTPASVTTATECSVASAANSAVDSVISSSSRSGASPDSSSAAATSSLKPVLGEVAGGDVDVHPQVLRPGGGVGAGAVQHPGAELGGEPVVLGGGEEGGRRQQPAGGVLPADERLVAEQRLVGQVDDRLVEEPQLLVLQRVLEVGLQLQRVDVVVGERTLVDLDAGAAAVGLGPGERALRLPQQVVGGHVRAEREADAGREGDLALVHEEGLVQDAEQPVGQRPQPGEVLDVLRHDEELVRTEPDGGVLDPGAPAQPVGDLAEQHVAGLVAEGLVDGLEPVDVQVHEADLQPAAAGQRDRVAEPVGERAAVGQPGERVGEGAADQVVLGPAAVGDVDEGEDDELRVAVVVADDLVRLDRPQLGAVGPAQPPLPVEQEVRVELQFTLGDVEPEIADRRLVGVGEQVDVPAGQFFRRPAGEGAHHRVRDQHVAVEVDEGLRDGRGEEQGLEQLAPIGEEGVDGPHALPGGGTGLAAGVRGTSEAGRLTSTGSPIVGAK